MSDQNNQQWKMTAKLPLLLIGLAAILGGWFLTLRGTMKAAVVGGLLIVGGLSAIVWSESIHNWCVPDNQKWGVSWGDLRLHNGPPSLQDCLALVGLAKPVDSYPAGPYFQQKVRELQH